jgi:hypothetical protein
MNLNLSGMKKWALEAIVAVVCGGAIYFLS